MLLSFPEYFGFEGLDDDVQRFISYINIAFALPVVFYSAKGYFIAAFQGLRQKYVNIDVPIALGIITLFSRSLYEILSQSGPGYLDSLSGLVFFLLIGKWIQSRTYDGLSFERDYKSYFPLAVSRISGDEKEIVQITELKEGDRIEVRNQEIIPADAVLISDHAAIDYSFVTGEAETIEKRAGDGIYAGGRQVGFAVVLDIIKPVSQSYLTQLWNKDTFNSESPYDSIIDRISKYFTLAVLMIALFTGIYWAFVEPSAVMNAVTAVLIVACPCALALATPFTLGNAMAILGKHKFYLKHMNVLQNLWNISEVIFDKTGTLTKGANTAVTFKGSLTDTEQSYILGLVNNSTHPLSRGIAKSLNRVKPVDVIDFQEVKGAGLSGVINSVVVKVGSAAFTEYPNPPQNVNTQVFATIDGQPIGYYTFGNTYRQEIRQMVQGLNYQLAVLSGDNASEKDNLSKIFPTNTHFIFNQKPEEKLSYIQHEQGADKDVLMLGDGLNDAGALKQANVGIAVTEDVSAFTPACDAILYGGNLAQLDKYLAFSLDTKKVIFASFTISFLYNVIGLSLAVSANLTPLFAAILMPLSSVTVVAFATFTVRWMAFRKGL
jgi:Cu+-exporting ATPase